MAESGIPETDSERAARDAPEDRVRRLGLGDCPCGAPIEGVSVGWTAGDHEMVAVCMRGHRCEGYEFPPVRNVYGREEVLRLLYHARRVGPFDRSEDPVEWAVAMLDAYDEEVS